MTTYAEEVLGEDDDNGTMPANVETVANAVIGHLIVAPTRSCASSCCTPTKSITSSWEWAQQASTHAGISTPTWVTFSN